MSFGFLMTDNGNKIVEGVTVEDVYNQIQHPTTIYTNIQSDYSSYKNKYVDVRYISSDSTYSQSAKFNHELTSEMLTPNVSYLLIQGLPYLFYEIFRLEPKQVDAKPDVHIPSFTVSKNRDGRLHYNYNVDNQGIVYSITNLGRYLNLPYIVGSIPSTIYTMFKEVKDQRNINSYVAGITGDIDCFVDVMLTPKLMDRCKQFLTNYFEPKEAEQLIPNYTKIFLRNEALISKSREEGNTSNIHSIFDYIKYVCTKKLGDRFQIEDKLYLKTRCNIGTITMSFGYKVTDGNTNHYVHLIDMIINGMNTSDNTNRLASYDGDFIQAPNRKYLRWRYLDEPIQKLGDTKLPYSMGSKFGVKLPYMISLSDGVELTTKTSWKWNTISAEKKRKRQNIHEGHKQFIEYLK